MISEQKSFSARKQQGLGSTKQQPPDTAPKIDVKQQHPRNAFSYGQGLMTPRARAFLTEQAKPKFQGPTNVARPDFLAEFTKLSFYDISCEGCGKWYKNCPDKKFPYPCMGKCQYEGHPSLNRSYKTGSKWKYPGWCCTWKGVSDKDIPQETLARLQKYQAQKRDRGSSA